MKTNLAVRVEDEGVSATSNEAGMFLPDVLLPSQHVRGDDRTAEKRLMFAVLESAVFSIGLPRPTVMPRVIDMQAAGPEAAMAWFMDDDRGWPYSFVNVCDVLDLDVDAVRAGVRRLYFRHHGAQWCPRPTLGSQSQRRSKGGLV